MTALTTVTSVDDLRVQVDAWRKAGETVAFVPTMGALHAGHYELVRQAKTRDDRVVVSVYVNPLQFGQGEDFETYPRRIDEDAAALAELGADVLWTPMEKDIYPEGPENAHHIDPGPVGELWEGAQRPGHFAGVLTVVKRLVEAVSPNYLVMGQKDAQQLWLVTAMLAEQAPAIEVIPVATVRDDDAVALSSRNAYLSQEERKTAQSIPRALEAAARESSPERAVAEAKSVLQNEPSMSVDYVALVDDATFREPEPGFAGNARLLIAVRVGSTRLIDNAALTFGQ